VFETFKEPAREAIARAQDEAREMGHEMVGVEHLLLDLLPLLLNVASVNDPFITKS
jgi:ATP-dependent Clp protease ATP-binding subunit ClpA